MIIIDKNLNRLDSFTPEKMALNLEERKSTATMTLGPEQPDLATGAWLLDDQEPGAGIVWRVKSVETQYNTKTRTVQLEHIINTLRDTVMFGEITAETIAGSGATDCYADQAARYCISYQSLWTIGMVEYSTSNPYNFNSEDIFGALETITSSLDDAYWDFDLRQLPFRLNIRRLSSSVESEMRMDRNVQTLRKTIDRSQMYTRFYAIGKDDLHLTGDYISKNEGTYGRVDHVETDSSMDTVDKLNTWAWERLNRHCEPTVTVQISGLELSQVTGEPLDHFQLNRKCRVPLPEYGTTIVEKITKISWPDKIADKTRINITLANQLTDIATIINSENKKSSSSGKQKAKDDKEDHAWMVDTDEHVGLVAEAVAGPGADKDWSRVSSIFVDGLGIHQKVVLAEGEIVKAFSAIEANEDSINLEVENRRREDAVLQGKITVEADRITQEVSERQKGEVTLEGKITVQADRITNEVSRAVNEERSLRGMIEVQADRVGMTVGITDSRPIRYIYQTQYLPRPGDSSVIYYCMDSGKYYEWNSSTNSYHLTTPGQYIKAGEICLAINESGETSATINANKIYLLGQTIANTITANYISSKIATIPSLTVQAVTGTNASFNNLYGGSISFRTSSGSGYAYTNLKDLFVTSLSISLENNTYTLTANNANAVAVSTVNFSRATTLSGAWSSGTYTVSASPQGNSLSTKLQILSPDGNISTSGKSVSRVFKMYYGPDEEHTADTGFQQTISIDASSVYDADHSMYATKYVSSSGSYVSTTSETLDYGGSITLYPTFTKSDGSTQQRGTGVTVTAPSNNYNTGFDADHSMYATKYVSSSSSYVATTAETINAGGSVTVYPTFTKSDGTTQQRGGGVTVTSTFTPSDYGIRDGGGTKRTSAISLGWGGSIDLYGGYTTDGQTWTVGDKVTVSGKSLPTIDNVSRKSTGITGTNAGDVSNKTGTYVTFSMAGSNYYIKIG